MNWIVSAVLLAIAAVNAQVQVKGRFQETAQQMFYMKDDKRVPIVKAEKKIDNFKEATAEVFENGRATKPYRFAETVELQLDATKQGAWENVKAIDGTPLKVWQAIVASDEAVSLSIQFEDFHLIEGAEFYIRGRDSMMGAFTPEVNNKDDNSFATMPIAGDFLGLLIAVPAANLDQSLSELRFRIASLAHGFRAIPKDFQDSANCNINAACETGNLYDGPKRAVAMLMTNDGTRFCTGTMINNSAKNKRQLFLTAHHCLGLSPSRFVAIFNYQFPTCQSTDVEPGVTQSATGMRLLSSWAPSDFALLEIIEKIPNNYRAYLAGWNMAKTAPSNVFGIHHPSCDVKKISYFTGTTQAAYWTEYPRMYHWMVPSWTRGTTEPGSSGSGLFNSNGQLVGQLHGGAAACDNPEGYDLYGAIAHSWAGGMTASTRLREYLNPRNLWISSVAGMELQR